MNICYNIQRPYLATINLFEDFDAPLAGKDPTKRNSVAKQVGIFVLRFFKTVIATAFLPISLPFLIGYLALYPEKSKWQKTVVITAFSEEQRNRFAENPQLKQIAEEANHSIKPFPYNSELIKRLKVLGAPKAVIVLVPKNSGKYIYFDPKWNNKHGMSNDYRDISTNPKLENRIICFLNGENLLGNDPMEIERYRTFAQDQLQAGEKLWVAKDYAFGGADDIKEKELRDILTSSITP